MLLFLKVNMLCVYAIQNREHNLQPNVHILHTEGCISLTSLAILLARMPFNRENRFLRARYGLQ